MEEIIREVLDEEIQIRKKNKMGITEDSKRMMEDRDIIRNRAVLTNLEVDWKEYRKIRNKCTDRIRKENK